MKKILIYFGSKGYEKSKERLYKSAEGYFDEIISYGEEDIDEQFYLSNRDLFNDVRGFGYWVWKAYFILKTLKSLDENDICFYVDSTAVFISSPQILINRCMESEGIVLFENAHYLNYHWTKQDCFNLMGLLEQKYLFGKQADAAFQLYKKNDKTLDFVNELLLYCSNYQIISDAPNITGDNHPEFKQHRWDQSILSLLAIKHNIFLAKSPRRPNSEYEIIIELKRDVPKPEFLIVKTN